MISYFEKQIEVMEDTYGCNLINTKRDGRQVTEFVGRYL